MKFSYLLFIALVVSCSAEVIELTEESIYDEILLSGKGNKWFIQFTAPWCGQCKKTVPIWNEVSQQFSGKVNFAKIDGSVSAKIARDFDVRNYPSFVFVQGKTFTKYEGPHMKEAFVEFASETYKYNKYQKIPQMPNAILLFLDNINNYLKKQLDTNPLFICGVMISVGMVIGIFLGVLSHYVMQEPVITEKKNN